MLPAQTSFPVRAVHPDASLCASTMPRRWIFWPSPPPERPICWSNGAEWLQDVNQISGPILRGMLIPLSLIATSTASVRQRPLIRMRPPSGVKLMALSRIRVKTRRAGCCPFDQGPLPAPEGQLQAAARILSASPAIRFYEESQIDRPATARDGRRDAEMLMMSFITWPIRPRRFAGR